LTINQPAYYNVDHVMGHLNLEQQTDPTIRKQNEKKKKKEIVGRFDNGLEMCFFFFFSFFVGFNYI
jgi:hypothetical protein